MIVKNLKGKEHNWNPKGKHTNRSRSSLHIQARELLYKRFPTQLILEEVPIKPEGQTLYLDFFLPLLKTAIEVHGRQHFEYTPQFHKNRLHFLKCCKNDRDKKEWLILNKIEFIELKWDNVGEWDSLIRI